MLILLLLLLLLAAAFAICIDLFVGARVDATLDLTSSQTVHCRHSRRAACRYFRCGMRRLLALSMCPIAIYLPVATLGTFFKCQRTFFRTFTASYAKSNEEFL